VRFAISAIFGRQCVAPCGGRSSRRRFDHRQKHEGDDEAPALRHHAENLLTGAKMPFIEQLFEHDED
jgi:hypothetical protein